MPLLDLSLWQTTTWDLPGIPLAEGIWDLSGPNIVTKDENNKPSVFCGGLFPVGSSVEGTVRLLGNDDDFFGFTYGYSADADTGDDSGFLLFDWKSDRDTNDVPFPAGLFVRHLDGPLGLPFLYSRSFDREKDGEGEILQRGATLGGLDWMPNRDYIFRFEFSRDSLKLFVDGGADPEIELSPEQYVDGEFCFYALSQEVRFSNFFVEPLATLAPTLAPTTLAPTPMPTPSSSRLPTAVPSGIPSSAPTVAPTPVATVMPSSLPSPEPSLLPTGIPTTFPSEAPTTLVTNLPSDEPTGIPTSTPSDIPSRLPSDVSSLEPSFVPTPTVSSSPTSAPTQAPSPAISETPSSVPSDVLCPSTNVTATNFYLWDPTADLVLTEIADYGVYDLEVFDLGNPAEINVVYDTSDTFGTRSVSFNANGVCYCDDTAPFALVPNELHGGGDNDGIVPPWDCNVGVNAISVSLHSSKCCQGRLLGVDFVNFDLLV